jgi:hypothetical protein
MKWPKNLGTILLAIWLILFGLLTAPFPQGELCLQRRPLGRARHRCRGLPFLAATVMTLPHKSLHSSIRVLNRKGAT